MKCSTLLKNWNHIFATCAYSRKHRNDREVVKEWSYSKTHSVGVLMYFLLGLSCACVHACVHACMCVYRAIITLYILLFKFIQSGSTFPHYDKLCKHPLFGCLILYPGGGPLNDLVIIPQELRQNALAVTVTNSTVHNTQPVPARAALPWRKARWSSWLNNPGCRVNSKWKDTLGLLSARESEIRRTELPSPSEVTTGTRAPQSLPSTAQDGGQPGATAHP